MTTTAPKYGAPDRNADDHLAKHSMRRSKTPDFKSIPLDVSFLGETRRTMGEWRPLIALQPLINKFRESRSSGGKNRSVYAMPVMRPGC